MLPIPSKDQAFRAFVESIFLNDGKMDDANVQQLLAVASMAGCFATPKLRREESIATKAGNTVPGLTWTFREHFNLLVAEAASTPNGASASDKIESFRLNGNPAEPDKFSTAELRSLREFGKWLILEELEDILNRFIDQNVWSVGDFKKISDFSKAHSAQGIVRSAFQTASEIKDDKVRDLGAEPPWKNDWAAIKGYGDVLKDNVGNLWKLRNMQKSKRSQSEEEAFAKESDSTELKAGSFVAEDEAVFSRTASFALAHGDLIEYCRLSPNWDNKAGWVKLPDDLSSAQRAHVQKRIDALKNDRNTRRFASESGRTVDEVAMLRELFFRAKPLVDGLSAGLVIKWEDVWDNLTDGPELVDLLVKPSSRRQSLSMGARAADRVARFILGAQIEILPKRLGIRVASLLAAVTVAGLVMILGIWAAWGAKEVLAAVAFFVSWVVFDQRVQTTLRLRDEKRLYIEAAALLGSLVLMILFAGWLQQGINQAYDRSYVDYLRGLRGQ